MTSASPVCLSAAENKPIWMHAEEREEMSKVRPPSDLHAVTHSLKLKRSDQEE